MTLKQKKGKGEGLFKVKKITEAMKGNSSMLIWLGKQRLGQKERREVVADVALTVAIMHYSNNLNPKTYS